MDKPRKKVENETLVLWLSLFDLTFSYHYCADQDSLFSFMAVLCRVSIHTWLMALGCGNGCSCLFSAKYALSITAVCGLSGYVAEPCPFVPRIRIVFCSLSMSD